MENKIAEMLNELGITANLRGYFYAKEAIALLYDNPMIPIVKGVYPIIAEKYKVPPKGVERCIRNAIEAAYKRASVDTLKDYFHGVVNPRNGKLSNSVFLATLAEKMRLDELKEAG